MPKDTLPPRPNDITTIAANEARNMRLERRRSSRGFLSPVAQTSAGSPRGQEAPAPMLGAQRGLLHISRSLGHPAAPSGSRSTGGVPLMSFGARVLVPSSGYAELDAIRQADRGLATSPHHTPLDATPRRTRSGDPPEVTVAHDTQASRWSVLSREEQIIELTAATTRQAWKNVQTAKQSRNTISLRKFSLQEAVERNYHNGKKVIDNIPVVEDRPTVLRGSSPAMIWSADEFPIVVHLPGAIRGQTLHDATEAIVEWGHTAKPSAKGSNDFNNCYKTGHELVGRTRLATLWHPIGHKHDPPVVCADIRKTGQSYEGAFKLFSELDLVNSYCTTALLAIDPLQYGLLRQVYTWRLAECKSQVAIAALDKYNLWEGREIMFNRWSDAHFDQHDAHYSWACLVYFGDFKQATMKFRQLNVEVRLRPGDVLFMRGRDLLHEVPDWGDGERHFMVYFTHESLWDAAGVQPMGRTPV